MKYVYILWSLFVFILVFSKDPGSLDNLTHYGIIIFFLITIFLYRKNRGKTIRNPKHYFISRAVLFAAIVEGCYMISKPVFPSLQWFGGISLSQMIQTYAIDLIFTLPAYFIIFSVIWWLANKYRYSVWEFVILMALGQALGDGSRTFLFNPALLLFLPYVMINYHAMTVLPYLKIKDSLKEERTKSWVRLVAPLILIPLTYIACGFIIYTIAGILHIK